MSTEDTAAAAIVVEPKQQEQEQEQEIRKTSDTKKKSIFDAQTETAVVTSLDHHGATFEHFVPHRPDVVEVDTKTSWFFFKNRPNWLNVILLIILIGFGMFEGFGFQSCGVTDPQSISEQMNFKVWIVMKLFIAAIGASMFFQGILDFFLPSVFNSTRDSLTDDHPWWKTGLGSAVLGVGMALSGSGTTMLPSQLGASSGNSAYAVIGYVSGGIVYAIVDAIWFDSKYESSDTEKEKTECSACEKKEQQQEKENAGEDEVVASAPKEQKDSVPVLRIETDISDEKNKSPSGEPASPGSPRRKARTFDEHSGIHYWKWATPCGLVFFGFACIIEFAISPTSLAADQERLHMGKLWWPSVVAGLILGFNQVVYRIIGQQGQGGARSFMSVISLLTWGKLAPKQFPDRWGRIWQIAFVWVGTPLGAFIAYTVHQPESFAAPGYSIWRNIVGGFLVMVGARIAGGCVCGHSISSLSEGGFMHVIAMICTFVGAIPTGFIIAAAS